jgi:hypothetical protein
MNLKSRNARQHAPYYGSALKNWWWKASDGRSVWENYMLAASLQRVISG